jgi:hypothetical protein
MKNILLIITLFISWNAAAVEKTWYCTTEKSGGLQYMGDTWKVVAYPNERMTVKQKDTTLSFSGKGKQFMVNKCKKIFPNTYDMIQCTGTASMFTLNTRTGLATSSSAFGWLSNGGEDGTYDTLSVDLWKCESF